MSKDLLDRIMKNNNISLIKLISSRLIIIKFGNPYHTFTNTYTHIQSITYLHARDV